jgi:predicted transcriptional regulator
MEKSSTLELNETLKVLENPARREIIKSLSQEPNYSFQLAKDTGLSQQQVAKHLQVMEKVGVVSSISSPGGSGPKRRVYRLSKSFSIVLNVAPHLYNEKAVAFDLSPEKDTISHDSADFIDRMDAVLDYPGGQDRIEPLAEIINDIDTKIEKLEEERLVLLYIRNSVMSEANKVIQRLDNSNARRVIYSAIDEHDSTVEGISKSLNLREDFVRETIERIKKEIKTEYL